MENTPSIFLSQVFYTEDFTLPDEKTESGNQAQNEFIRRLIRYCDEIPAYKTANQCCHQAGN